MDVIRGSISPVRNIRGNLSGTNNLSGNLSVPPERPYDLQPATTSTLGGVIVGEHLQITSEGVLSVTVANDMEGDNTNPISSAAVYMEVGNINALLGTI